LLQRQRFVAVGILLFPILAPSQQSAPPSSTPITPRGDQSSYTLKVNSQLVLLDTVVRDQKGNAVRNLKRDGFTILEDGVPQPISAFEAIDTTAPSAERPVIHSTEELEKTTPNTPVTILVLDELTTRFEDEYFARYSLGKYLGAQNKTLSEPTILLARTYNRTMVLRDYTTSRKEILDALNRHFVGNAWRASVPEQASNLFGAGFASLIEVAKATEGHAGHKNLIWLGRGFPTIEWSNLTADQAGALQTAIVSCSNLLRDARITLYSINPSGISVSRESTVDSNGNLPLTDPFAGQIDFDTIAESTGGIAMHGRNDVDRMIAQAVGNGEVFYSLAYRSAAPSDDDPKKLHRIKVVMKDPRFIATSRDGYYTHNQESVAALQASGDVSDARELDLAGAINGLMVYSGIPLEVARRDKSDQYQITFPAEPLALEETDGKLTGQIDLIVLSFDRFGKALSKSGRVISLHLPALPAGTSENRKVTINATVENTGTAARIRFVMRAHLTGRIGAENYFLADRNLLKDPSTGLKVNRSQPK